MAELMDWNGRYRRDGLVIELAPGPGIRSYIVLPADDSPAIDKCPRCDCLITTIECAKRAADTVYPLARVP